MCYDKRGGWRFTISKNYLKEGILWGVKIKNPIGQIFRKYNVVEYKSPKDTLNIDDLFKTVGYAMFYKGTSKRVDEIGADELTVSMFVYATPRGLFRKLKNLEIEIEKTAPGVYHIAQILNVPVQVIVIKELDDDEHTALKLLSFYFKSRSRDLARDLRQRS